MSPSSGAGRSFGPFGAPRDASAPLPSPLLIGLTGPIGCGKSTVARMLRELGGTEVDADDLARRVTGQGGPALHAVRARFGERVFRADGGLDRAALAEIVFSDADALRALEAIVHPEVRRLVAAALDEAADARAPFVAVEAIKLVEGGLADRCDEVWLIECSEVEQRARLASRGMAAPDVERRLDAQGRDLAERLAARATRRIVTSGSLDELRERVEEALADALVASLADRPGGPPSLRSPGA